MTAWTKPKESVDDHLAEVAGEELLSCTITLRSVFVSCICMIWCASHAVQLMSPSTLPCFSSFFLYLTSVSFSPASRTWCLGWYVRVSGFEAGLAVFMCTHRVVLSSFVFRLSSLSLPCSCAHHWGPVSFPFICTC